MHSFQQFTEQQKNYSTWTSIHSLSSGPFSVIDCSASSNRPWGVFGFFKAVFLVLLSCEILLVDLTQFQMAVYAVKEKERTNKNIHYFIYMYKVKTLNIGHINV